MSPYGRGTFLPFKAQTTLLGPVEKARIIEAMKKGPARCALTWAKQFRRLVPTIQKLAHEAGVVLLP